MATYYIYEANTGWVQVSGTIASPLTTKGDIYGYSTTDARIPVGTDGDVLTADSTQALGVKWAAGTSPLTTKGDLYGYSTTDARVPVGTDGDVLTADSSQATGVAWSSTAAAGVSSLDSITGAVTLVAGSNVTITDNSPSAGDITIAASSGGSSEIGYDQVTSNTVVTSTSESAGTTIISAAAHTFSGATVLAEFFSPSIQVSGTVGDYMNICLFEGTTEITRLGGLATPVTSSNVNAVPGYGARRFTPSAGSHTYTVTAYLGGTGTPAGLVLAGTGIGAAQPPCFLRFTYV